MQDALDITKDTLADDLKYVNNIERPTEEEIQEVINAGFDLSDIIASAQKCPYCHGTGHMLFNIGQETPKDGICPYCKAKAKAVIDTDYWNYSGERLQIPAMYRKQWVETEVLENLSRYHTGLTSNKDKEVKSNLQYCANTMQSILFQFETKWKDSGLFYFISVDNILMPDLWTINLLQMYRAKGFSLTNPCFLQEINIDSTYESKYFTVEVLLLKLNLIDKKEVLKIDSIIAQRTLKGLVTIVVSPIPLGSYIDTSENYITTVPSVDITYFK